MADTVTPTQLAADIWGGKRLEGERFSEPQKTEMRRRRGSLDGWDTRIIQLKVPRAPNEFDRKCLRPADQCFDVVDVECPIVRRGADSDSIITTGGDIINVRRARK